MENPEVKNSKNGWLRNLLFGKKRKSSKRVPCECNSLGIKQDKVVQTNNGSDVKEEEKLPAPSGDQKSIIQKHGECPGKIFPMERRGCGFHLYFCIDNGNKPNFSKNLKMKKFQNEKSKIDNGLDVDKSVSATTELESLPESTRPHRSHSPLKYPRNINPTEREKSPTETQLSGSPSSVHPDLTGVKSKENEVGKHINNSSPRTQEEVKSSKGSSILRSKKTSQDFNMLANFNVHSATPAVNYLSPLERQFNTEEEVKIVKEQRSNTEVARVKVSEPDEEAIFKEYEALRQSKVRRRSSMRSGHTIARNSLISLRKKRTSFVDSVVPEILSKLDHIEAKLAELEKVYEDRGKTITNIVGISCNSAKSQNNQNVGEDINASSNASLLKLNSFHVQPVLIKSCCEDVIVNSPESVSVVRKKKSKQASSQLVYHNTQELDAHNFSSKSFSKTKTFKSPPHERVSEVSKHPSKVKGPDMWRRISEELKF